MCVRLRLFLIASLCALVAVPASAGAPYKPLRIAAYYPWFPEGWTYAEMSPFTHYSPSLGFYDASDKRVIARHVRAMQWGRIRAATYSWWGRESPTDNRLSQHLEVAAKRNFTFAIYYEWEGYADPSVEQLRADLEYIRDRYAPSPGYLKVDNRFVVFVYGDADDGLACEVAERWRAASADLGAYLVLRAFSGYRGCHAQPDSWHTYSADKNAFNLSPYSYSISPGFFFAKEDRPARHRNLARWARNVRAMTRSPAQFHYVISFNEWGEGTAVESAFQWASRSGFGDYLDVLHAIRRR